MRKRYYQDTRGIRTNSDAMMFAACSSLDDLLGEEEWGYAAILLWKNNLKVFTKKDVQTAPYKQEHALYRAISMGLEFCTKNNLKKVEIIYDADGFIADKFPNPGSVDPVVREVSEVFPDGKAKTYWTNYFDADVARMMDAFRRNVDNAWLDSLDAEAIYVTLVKELARGIIEDEGLARDISTNYIYSAAEMKKVTFEKASLLESDTWVVRDMFDNGSTDVKKSERKTILDMVLERAESIKKNKMTVFHLLYGFASFCLMLDSDIMQEMELEEDEFSRIEYTKKRLLMQFDAEAVRMDLYKIKTMIPMYIEQFERDSTAVDDYERMIGTVRDWKAKDTYADEVIVLYMLNALLLDTKNFHPNGLNQAYLNFSKEVLLKKRIKPDTKEEENIEKIAKQSTMLYDTLSEKVFGQDVVIQKFVQGYINSKLAGNSRKGKPAASFLFAGPPGVGKTYLAKVASEVLHMPLKVLDMSEYPDEHSVWGLVGFEKSYKQAGPGRLTSFVSENPACILLIDEIEKAHVAAKMLFLQVLEGARLTDKFYNEEVNFENVIVIFTTNSGKELYEDNETADLSALSETEILDTLREDGSFPKELCSRFASGSIMMFNHLPSYYLADIVKSKMNEVTADMEKNYQLKISYDALLPELFLFQAGSNIDARVASGQSADFVKKVVVDFVKERVEKEGELKLDKLSIEINLDKENEEIYSRFVNKEEGIVLVVSDSGKFKSVTGKYNIVQATDENEMVQILRDNRIDAAIIDLSYKVSENIVASNALGVESVGMDCFETIHEKAPQIPVYVTWQETYGAEDRKAIMSKGARGFFVPGKDEKMYTKCINKILDQLNIQRNLELLKQKGERMGYKIRYRVEDSTGIIELYDMWLKTVGADDAALRRKAKKSKVFDFERPTMRFADIIGAEQAKRDFKHFINYMNNIEKYIMEGAEIPKGVLLYGPPGTGKTSLAKALAGECGALFLNTTGASIRNSQNPVDEIKDLFKIAYINAPAIIFIDEVDVIAKERTGYDNLTELMVNTLLTEMEGFSDKDPFKPVFVVAATNYGVDRQSARPGEVIIDPAFVRRFDNPVYVGLPSHEERKQYLQMLLKKKNYDGKISEGAIDYVVERTGGSSLAFMKRAISNLTNRAIDENKRITDDLLIETMETQLYGEKRENDEEYRLSVARHETGHAFVGFKTGREPKFITIVSRGHFGGYVSYGDGEDTHNLTKDDFLNYICQALAGRAAEMVYYGEKGINTGASGDLDHATKYALRMLCYFGMGNMGLVSLDPEHILETSKGAELLEEANKILEQQLERAIKLIRENKKAIDRVVEVLMDKSYIQGEQLISVLEESAQETELETIQENASQRIDQPKKWYVVINGRNPGIYTTWEACRAQVAGYRNAVYRSYISKEEALNAQRASQVGVKNIRDKKLLYHLIKLSDLKEIRLNGLLPEKELDGKKYVNFYFHAYAADAVEEQKNNPNETYAYLCISRELAAKWGCKVRIEDLQNKHVEVYDYETGFAKIDWKQMEQTGDSIAEQINVQCLSEEAISLSDVAFIYVPDEKSAAQAAEMCAEMAAISVNKRMFRKG